MQKLIVVVFMIRKNELGRRHVYIKDREYDNSSRIR